MRSGYFKIRFILYNLCFSICLGYSWPEPSGMSHTVTRRLGVASVSNDHAGVFAKDTSGELAKAAKT